MRQVDVIRGNADRIIPWLSARKTTGKKYTYEEILVNLGLPADKNMRRTLSKFVNGKGIRRRRFTPKGEKVVVEGVIKQPEDIPEVIPLLIFPKQSRKERFLSACQAFADIYFTED